MPGFINPFTDFGFKRLFGSEPNKDILIDFLNVLLPEKHRIVELNYTKNEFLGESPIVDRKAIFDISCRGVDGEWFIVELQKARQRYFKDRSIFYSAFPIMEQGQKGEWDFRPAPIYTISVLDFLLDDGDEIEEVSRYVQLCDIKRSSVFYDKLTFIYLEIPRFSKEVNELESDFDKWIFVLQNLHKVKERPEKLEGRIFEKLFRAAEIERFDKEERQAYDESLKYYRDLKNVLDTA